MGTPRPPVDAQHEQRRVAESQLQQWYQRYYNTATTDDAHATLRPLVEPETLAPLDDASSQVAVETTSDLPWPFNVLPQQFLDDNPKLNDILSDGSVPSRSSTQHDAVEPSPPRVLEPLFSHSNDEYRATSRQGTRHTAGTNVNDLATDYEVIKGPIFLGTSRRNDASSMIILDDDVEHRMPKSHVSNIDNVVGEVAVPTSILPSKTADHDAAPEAVTNEVYSGKRKSLNKKRKKMRHLKRFSQVAQRTRGSLDSIPTGRHHLQATRHARQLGRIKRKHNRRLANDLDLTDGVRDSGDVMPLSVDGAQRRQ